MGQLILIVLLSFFTGIAGMVRGYAIGFGAALLIVAAVFLFGFLGSGPQIGVLRGFLIFGFAGSLGGFLIGLLIRKIVAQMSGPNG